MDRGDGAEDLEEERRRTRKRGSFYRRRNKFWEGLGREEEACVLARKKFILHPVVLPKSSFACKRESSSLLFV